MCSDIPQYIQEERDRNGNIYFTIPLQQCLRVAWLVPWDMDIGRDCLLLRFFVLDFGHGGSAAVKQHGDMMFW
jgi:hypothetical protein